MSPLTHTFQFLSLNDVMGLWPTSKHGQDVIVGVICSGVWPESPCYRDNGMSEVPARWKGACDNLGDFYRQIYMSKSNAAAWIFICDDAQKFNYFHYPWVIISHDDAPFVLNYAMNNATPLACLKFQKTLFERTHTPVVSTYTSHDFALSFIGILKHYLMAPDTLILAAWVLWSEGRYALDVLHMIDHAIADGVEIIAISRSEMCGYNLKLQLQLEQQKVGSSCAKYTSEFCPKLPRNIENLTYDTMYFDPSSMG
ncbi:hypothetical protein BUALT_Bualt08G0048300 [Buddleja alternifolia]|uniref:Uncharacterized protein n=1 Tax=Buddleja alternifolia TaxID=168488 RepID=A0AAV6XBR1_9LAMI|nr:hypothetical protein BUALT_Bualt08G0048300 [Buddleja alternifolia]